TGGIERMNHRNISAIAFVLIAALTICSFTTNSKAQALSAGTITGMVVDPNGAVVANATVTIINPITGYKRTVNTDANGSFHFNDVPPNNYQLNVSARGFSAAPRGLAVRTPVRIR